MPSPQQLLAEAEGRAQGAGVQRDLAARLPRVQHAPTDQRHVIAGQRLQAIAGTVARLLVAHADAITAGLAAAQEERRLADTGLVPLALRLVPDLLGVIVQLEVQLLTVALEIPVAPQQHVAGFGQRESEALRFEAVQVRLANLAVAGNLTRVNDRLRLAGGLIAGPLDRVRLRQMQVEQDRRLFLVGPLQHAQIVEKLIQSVTGGHSHEGRQQRAG